MIIISIFSLFLIVVGLPLVFGLLSVITPAVICIVALILQGVTAVVIFIYGLIITLVEKCKIKRREK